MEARLRVLLGGTKEREHLLNGGKITVGRADECDVCINHSSVSRLHCSIVSRSGGFRISDLQSLNGTLVNGTRVSSADLSHGDRLQIGDYTAIFEVEALAEAPEPQILVEDDYSLPPDSVLVSQSEIETVSKDLEVFTEIAKQISIEGNLDRLQLTILRYIFEVVPATEGAIVLADSPSGIRQVTGHKRCQSNESTLISKTVLSRVLSEKKGFFAADVIRESGELQSESLAISGTISLICTPLVLYDEIIGALYLTTDDSENRFDQHHLGLTMAVSSIAAVAIENLRNVSFLRRENRMLKESRTHFGEMLGESPAMQKVFEFISRVSGSDSTALICGESGTGKELAARAIHSASPRTDRPFVVINCATITETLMESELFGHEKGAFTGAASRKTGKVELADGGTLFLDEIGELAPSLQAKLLRVLQEREFERVGGTKSIKVDIRLIAATNRDLESEVTNGRFREDLFYRLNVIKLDLPPLRKRGDDVLLLANAFLRKFQKHAGRTLSGISRKAERVLLTYKFPGNVRELENAIEAAVVLGASEWIQPEDLPEKFIASSGPEVRGPGSQTLQQGVREAKGRLIGEAFESAGRNYVKAAKILDVHPNYLHRLIKTLGIKNKLSAE